MPYNRPIPAVLRQHSVEFLDAFNLAIHSYIPFSKGCDLLELREIPKVDELPSLPIHGNQAYVLVGNRLLYVTRMNVQQPVIEIRMELEQIEEFKRLLKPSFEPHTLQARELKDILRISNQSKIHHDSQAMDYAELRTEVLALETKYDAEVRILEASQSYFASACRKVGSAVGPTNRGEQIHSINEHLLPLLDQQLEREPFREEQCISILLGALIYRYIRIMASYKNQELQQLQSRMWGLFSSAQSAPPVIIDLDPNNWALVQSALCRTIGKILGLSETNRLDYLTIMKHCIAFRDYLKIENIKAQVPYMRDDKDFFKNLQDIINVAEEGSKLLVEQIEYIQFIQSVEKTLKDFEERISLALDELLIKPKEAEIVFSKKSIRDYLERRDYLVKISFVERKEKLQPWQIQHLKKVLLDTEEDFSNDIRADDLSRVIEHIKHRLVNVVDYYTILGAYALVLGDISLEKNMGKPFDILRGLLNMGMGIDKTNRLDMKTRAPSLKTLASFLKLKGVDACLDTNCWGKNTEGFTALEAALTEQQLIDVDEAEEVSRALSA